MLAFERKEIIKAEILQSGSILVSEMSKKLDCSEETIRRDLKDLETDGKIKRIHGGAYLSSLNDRGLPIRIRQTLLLKEKQDIADYAFSHFISENDTIMLDSSTICVTFAKKLVNVLGKSVIKQEDVPAATQLFTTDWVVRYMVDNSLGRYWIERHPEGSLAEKLDFLVKPKNGKFQIVNEATTPQDLTFFEGDYIYIRASSLYYIEAEALARLGQTAQARQVLYDITSVRDTGYTLSTNSGQSLIDEIILQKRIELWGEGLAYFDLLRLNKGIDRRDVGFEQSANYNVPANSRVMIIPIPQKEREANKAVKTEDYNPLGKKPEPAPLTQK